MYRLLLIEDDAAVRQFVAMALEDEPLSLHSCASLSEARQWLAQTPEPPHVVLLDLMLPDGSGLELLDDAELRARLPAVAWLLFSAGRASSLRSDPEQLQRWGVREVLEKPVSLSRLLQTVRAACAPEAADGSEAAEVAAVTQFFEGQRALFEQMRRFSAPQLRTDLAQLHEASAAAMNALGGQPQLAIASLRFKEAERLAHSMKTVLAMLGCPASSRLARLAEAEAEKQEPEALQRAVQALEQSSGTWPLC